MIDSDVQARMVSRIGGDNISSYSKQAVIAVILLSAAVIASAIICIMLAAGKLSGNSSGNSMSSLADISSDVKVFSGDTGEYKELLKNGTASYFDVFCIHSEEDSDKISAPDGYSPLAAGGECKVFYNSEEYSARISRPISSADSSGFATYALFESSSDDTLSFAVFCADVTSDAAAEALCSRILCYRDYFPVFVSLTPGSNSSLLTEVCGMKAADSSSVDCSDYVCSFSVAGKTSSAFCLDLEDTKLSLDIDDAMIALTYDDGPDPEYTEYIIEALSKNNSKATFFVMGAHVTEHPGLVKKAFDAGCEIGNHTNLHESFDKNPLSIIKLTIETTNSAIRKEIGIGASLVRPPNGITLTNRGEFAKTGYPLVLWSIDTCDYADGKLKDAVISTAKNAENGDIILMHDIHAPSAEAAEELVSALCERFRLVTVSELLEFKSEDGITADSVYRSADTVAK